MCVGAQLSLASYWLGRGSRVVVKKVQNWQMGRVLEVSYSSESETLGTGMNRSLVISVIR
jgi:hypothetical protein